MTEESQELSVELSVLSVALTIVNGEEGVLSQGEEQKEETKTSDKKVYVSILVSMHQLCVWQIHYFTF